MEYLRCTVCDVPFPKPVTRGRPPHVCSHHCHMAREATRKREERKAWRAAEIEVARLRAAAGQA